MKKIIKSIIPKVVILIIAALIGNCINQAIRPLMLNNLAMMQMQNSVDSSIWIQLYVYVANYTWLLWLVIIVIIFKKDIKELYKILRSKKENEKN